MFHPDVFVDNSYRRGCKCLLWAPCFFYVFYSSVSCSPLDYYGSTITSVCLKLQLHFLMGTDIIECYLKWEKHRFLYFQRVVSFYPHLQLAFAKGVCVQEKKDLNHKCYIRVQYICVFYCRLLRQRWLDWVWGKKADLIWVYFGKRCVVLLTYYTSNYWDYMQSPRF